MELARGPAACMDHQFAVTTQAWCGDPQQRESRPLAQTKYDTFATLAYQTIENSNWCFIVK